MCIDATENQYSELVSNCPGFSVSGSGFDGPGVVFEQIEVVASHDCYSQATVVRTSRKNIRL